MNHFRKAVAAAAAVAITALILSGCTAAAPTSKVKLSFLAFTSPSITKALWESAVKNIEKKEPNVSIQLLYTPTLDRQGYAKQLLASGQLPDILWDAPLADFVKAKALLPFKTSDFQGLNIPKGFNAIGGKQYNLSTGLFIDPGIFYNPDAFKKAGIAVPKTWSDFMNAAATLKAQGTTPFLLSGGSDTWSTAFLMNALVTADISSKDPKWLAERKAGTVKFSDANFVHVVKKFIKLRDAGFLNSDALSINYAQATAAWATGKYAMWPMGGWGGGVKSDVFTPSVFAMPTESGAAVLPTVIGPSIYVSSKTAHPVEARRVAVEMAHLVPLQQSQMVSDAQFPIVSGITPPKGTTQATIDGLKIYNDKSYQQVYGFPNALSGDDTPPSGWGDEYNKAMQALVGGGSAADAWTTLSK
jgi:ABC-type glycerol-3-phosphate transport system substrate-binding protein